MSKLNFAMFMAGLTVGSVAAWFCLKKHYEQIAQEEIDSVKKVFAERRAAQAVKDEDKEQIENQHKADIAKLKPDLMDYAAFLQKEGYTNYTEHSQKEEKKKETETMTAKPYILTPDEFGMSEDDYSQISLVYYADGVLADEEDEPVEDEASIVGEEYMSHFGEYEQDTVYIRNDRLKCDYEILRDHRSFREVTGREV